MLKKRIIEPIKNQLKQGVTPGKLALALALGLVIGSLPILFISSLLCGIVAYLFKLNQPAIQVANYVAYPLQIALFVPFFRAGAAVFGEPASHFSFDQIQAAFSADVSKALGTYAGANLRALTVWAVLAPLAVVLIFFALKFLLSRVRMPAREV